MRNLNFLQAGLLKSMLFVSLILGVTVLNAQDEKTTDDATKVKSVTGVTFDKTIHDFGTIKEVDGVTNAIFTFTNSSDKPLVVSNVSASCGCTVSKWTKEPVQPGETGVVEASYNPAGRVYPFDKTLTVSSNGEPNRIVLHIKGTVVK